MNDIEICITKCLAAIIIVSIFNCIVMLFPDDGMTDNKINETIQANRKNWEIK